MAGSRSFAAGRLSSGVVVVNVDRDRPRFLLLRAFSHWDFPKGMVENGESALDAAEIALLLMPPAPSRRAEG